MDYSSTNEIFSHFQKYMDDEQELREKIRHCVREIEQAAREMTTTYQRIHQAEGIKHLPELCAKGKASFQQVQELLKNLAAVIPNDQYYRFHDHWRFVMQRLCFLAALNQYLEDGSLISKSDIVKLMGVMDTREDGFHLDLEDYLFGLLQLANELSRWAVNAVTSGDYGRPLEISKFMCELDAGFRLLNLKNDALRKRFDGLKYDLKKVEEVVYDVTIRGLRPVAAADSDKDEAINDA